MIILLNFLLHKQCSRLNKLKLIIFLDSEKTIAPLIVETPGSEVHKLLSTSTRLMEDKKVCLRNKAIWLAFYRSCALFLVPNARGHKIIYLTMNVELTCCVTTCVGNFTSTFVYYSVFHGRWTSYLRSLGLAILLYTLD